MDENQKDRLPTEEDNIQEEKDAEPEDFNLDAKDSKVSHPKMSGEDLRRPPLHPEEKSLQKTTGGQHSNFNKNKGTEERSAPTSSPESPYSMPRLCLGVLALAVVVGVVYACSAGSSTEKQLDVKELMKDLRGRFGGQPPLTYRLIERAIETASSEDSDSPGILVLISGRKAEETTLALANMLVRLVSDPLDSVLVEVESPSLAGGLKKEIDDVIRGNLTEQRVRAVQVRHLDRIPFDAAMIFHGYCDHENAPFKRAVYVMTALVEEEISPDSGIRDWDALATRRLSAAWGDSGTDQVTSLISRLTVNVAAVLPK